MVEKNVGLLVLSEPTDTTRIFGVVSERDIIRSIAAGEQLEGKVDSICSRHVVTVNANADVAEAAKAMNRHKIRHVVVLDDRGSPVGVVSMRDLVGERATLTAILQSNEKEIFAGGD